MSLSSSLVSQWSSQQNAIGSDKVKFGIQDSPSILIFGNQIFMVWNGSGNDGIWYSVYDMDTQK